ncbi:hypothetical protein RRF57_005609 [Xylaria bambusicola]|uniref:Uncharacterized protein n=1 Tax=Xylaria bambusicola TaxID=326684 RepID=A0AAN7UQJ5_9PEZI
MKVYEEEDYKFKKMIVDIWSLLESIMDQKVSAKNSFGLTISLPFQATIQGYKFKAIVENRLLLPTKKIDIRKASGGWLTVVRDIDALVLFADGFGDLIKPVGGNDGLCHSWKTVPQIPRLSCNYCQNA